MILKMSQSPFSSQSQGFERILASYYSAVESFEYVDSLFNNGQVNLRQIEQELHKCFQKLEVLIAEENSPYLMDILQLKQLTSNLIKLTQRKIAPVPKAPKFQQNKTFFAQRAQCIADSTIETPRVRGLKEIAGLCEIKKVLKSLVILPRNQPQLFVNRKACNSVLLFGPPGTGKTRLVHALASEANAVLRCVSVGSLLSPLVGETEKNVEALFKHIIGSRDFSILFIDEIDGFCRTRHDSEQDHTRRMKTELMCQMSKMEDKRNLFLVCATNCPWDLDTAFLRRFQKRIYVPLPNQAERQELFQLFTKNSPLDVHSGYWHVVFEKTEGFSGSDLSDLIQCALNVPITELEDSKIWKRTQDGFYEPVVMAEDFNLEEIICCDLQELPCQSVRARPAQVLDILHTLDSMCPTVSVSNIKKYESFISK